MNSFMVDSRPQCLVSYIYMITIMVFNIGLQYNWLEYFFLLNDEIDGAFGDDKRAV